MKYFLDTEFIEGFKKPIKWLPTIGGFNKPYHSIQLISIGIVAEDGREYYAISNEFNPRDADTWVKDNVLLPIYLECVSGDMRNYANYSTKKNGAITWGKGKSNKQIAQEIFEFCSEDVLTLEKAKHYNVSYENRNIEFYAYYADYDWVVFCSLFGTMMDLPKGFPMYCKDLKQSLDNYVIRWKDVIDDGGGKSLPFHQALSFIKNEPTYPKQENEHNALADAKWNKKLFGFLTLNNK